MEFDKDMRPELHKRPIRVKLLNGEAVIFYFEPKTLVKEIFLRVCQFCSIEENQVFGLSVEKDRESVFLDTNEKIYKYAPKTWVKTPQKKASQINLSRIFDVEFQVQFFVEHERLIQDPFARHNYYLHLKRNVLSSSDLVSDELVFSLASCSLHIESGQFDTRLHQGSYFNPHDHCPKWFIVKWQESFIIANLPKMHEHRNTMTQHEVEGEYIKLALRIEDVPVHSYDISKHKYENQPSVTMKINQSGVRFVHTSPRLNLNYEWNKVGRLSFKKRRFEIYPSEVDACHRLTYFTRNARQSQYFLRLLKDAHSLYMSLSPYMEQVRKEQQKLRARPDFRVSYIYGIDPDGKEKEIRVANLRKSGINLRKNEKNKQKQESETEESTLKASEDSTLERDVIISSRGGSSHTSGIESNKNDDDVTTADDVTEGSIRGSMIRSESSRFDCSVDSGSYVVQETRNETDKDSGKEEEESPLVASPPEECPPPYTTDDEGKNDEDGSEEKGDIEEIADGIVKCQLVVDMSGEPSKKEDLSEQVANEEVANVEVSGKLDCDVTVNAVNDVTKSCEGSENENDVKLADAENESSASSTSSHQESDHCDVIEQSQDDCDVTEEAQESHCDVIKESEDEPRLASMKSLENLSEITETPEKRQNSEDEKSERISENTENEKPSSKKSVTSQTSTSTTSSEEKMSSGSFFSLPKSRRSMILENMPEYMV